MTGFDDRDPLVSLSDVAELTGMSRSAISNWRRRFRDFPEPDAGTAANPQFRFSAIRDWLAAHPGLGGRIPTPSDISVVHLWAALNPHRGRITAELGVEALLSLITWHHLRRRGVEPVSDAPMLAPVPTDGRTLTDIWARAISGVRARRTLSTPGCSGHSPTLTPKCSPTLCRLHAPSPS